MRSADTSPSAKPFALLRQSSSISRTHEKKLPDNPTPAACTALVAEDEWLVRMDIVSALEDAGFVVVEAESAEHALLLMGEVQAQVLVTDIRLAGALDGWSLAEEYRRGHPAGGVVYASANVPLADRQVDDSVFFSKPVLMSALVEACLGLCGDQDKRPR
ncbi:response regulator [Sphingopyxis sp. JAI108]|uniref:response regulator n=1 Tax=Sphingopyxis sp. JAI108 TaxID=2723060 RepID=UPI0015CD13BE|nr:response regulator [Sphingopyxis sp. JAI108]NYF33669.1 CheY-like chemotaxis protein [Sphingopyxis sp. JAI108]